MEGKVRYRKLTTSIFEMSLPSDETLKIVHLQLASTCTSCQHDHVLQQSQKDMPSLLQAFVVKHIAGIRLQAPVDMRVISLIICISVSSSRHWRQPPKRVQLSITWPSCPKLRAKHRSSPQQRLTSAFRAPMSTMHNGPLLRRTAKMMAWPPIYLWEQYGVHLRIAFWCPDIGHARTLP